MVDDNPSPGIIVRVLEGTPGADENTNYQIPITRYPLPISNHHLPGSGIYFYRMTIEGLDKSSPYTRTKKLILLR